MISFSAAEGIINMPFLVFLKIEVIVDVEVDFVVWDYLRKFSLFFSFFFIFYTYKFMVKSFTQNSVDIMHACKAPRQRTRKRRFEKKIRISKLKN